MSDTLIVRITLENGRILEVEKDFEDAKAFLVDAERYGFTVNGQFYGTNMILTMEAFPPRDASGICDN
jgi:hypothetical protein